MIGSIDLIGNEYFYTFLFPFNYHHLNSLGGKISPKHTATEEISK